MSIELTKTNFKTLSNMIEDEATLNKVMGIIEKEAKRQAKILVKTEKQEKAKAKKKAEKEATKRQKSIDSYKLEMEKEVKALMNDEFGNIVTMVTYPLATKWYFDNLEGRAWNKVRTIKYNAIKDSEQSDEKKEFLRVFGRMNQTKKWFMIQHLNETLTMDLEYAKNLKSMKSNKVDEMVWEIIQ